MGRRRTWTMAQLQEAKARAESGETWASIAADFNISPSTVRKQVRTHIGPVSSRPSKQMPQAYATKLQRAIVLRNMSGASWPIIADKIEWHASNQALRKAVARFARENELEVRQGFPDVRRSRWENA